MVDIKISIIGLGYVGLPLAVEFAKKYPVCGFDINTGRIARLKEGIDDTLEVAGDDLVSVLKSQNDLNTGLFFGSEKSIIADSNFYIVTVPTPVDKYNRPVLTPLIKASESIGEVLKKGDIVVYESTVYPGLTEEECVPVLERVSGLKYNEDFFVGYSPERINPGDKKHTVTKIQKVTSGSTDEAAEIIDSVYREIIVAGTFKASSIKVAEAAKVIENAQRDINIAFVNELAKIFSLMEIDTTEVLAAAGTKWNFLPFKPGLVGGHCIGVDPFYLAQKAQELGYHPEIILAGRRMNDSMGSFVSSEVVKLMVAKDIQIKNADVLVLGITFKENCPDIRNTKAIDVIKQLQSYHFNVDVYDPWASDEEVKQIYGIDLLSKLDKKYNAVVLTVSHEEFKTLDMQEVLMEEGVVYDVKSFFNKELVDARL
mgnify:CR=1 FL=1